MYIALEKNENPNMFSGYGGRSPYPVYHNRAADKREPPEDVFWVWWSIPLPNLPSLRRLCEITRAIMKHAQAGRRTDDIYIAI